jgi:hypothetical protein
MNELEQLTRNIGEAVQRAYDKGYSEGAKDQLSEAVTILRQRQKIANDLGRDATELILAIGMLMKESNL